MVKIIYKIGYTLKNWKCLLSILSPISSVIATISVYKSSNFTSTKRLKNLAIVGSLAMQRYFSILDITFFPI